MANKHTLEELNSCSREELITLVLMMQGQLDALNSNIEKLIEQVRISNSYRFGKHTETLSSIEGQYSFFDEAEMACDESAPEPDSEDVIPSRRGKKKKGQRNLDLKDFAEEIIPPYSVPKEQLDAFYGEGNWRRMPDESYKRLRHEPESWTVEVHTVEVYVGTDGDHQDEFIRGDRPKDLLRNSIVTPSLLASILNVKYVNSSALHRIEQEFERNGVNISRQTMSNWIVKSSNKYFAPFVERMKQELLKLHVTQSDETPTQVIKDSDHPNSRCYMWVHRSGELYHDKPIVIYEYQKGRDHQIPLAFYKDYKGVLVTDSLQQYHLVDKKLPNVTNANCWAHARRDFADALKAADKDNPKVLKQSVAYQALQRIAEFYSADTELKGLSSEERLQKRLQVIKPLVEEFFTWVKQQVADCAVPPQSKTGRGLQFCLNQEKYLKVFLTDGDVPIDNSASERAIRTFCLGKKNWMFHNTARGAGASAMVYSISETAKLNNLRPYYYFKYILTELPKLCDEQGNIDPTDLDYLMPWSESLPDECRKPRH
ncbi:IS66 family transposase [Lachnospiraceae bacterium MD1]|uniref:IS66 family transposase n=1 Tax=Variimorphobacter saccharofermentans TaxID=2755051 RepID=A0A839K3Y6_9FIRM|nr:IS66 family transposase [Variimorphobacter saccharofermentans]MBB2184615.1 IS66 family transposase [Variimorphobacter saccharofermentans]